MLTNNNLEYLNGNGNLINKNILFGYKNYTEFEFGDINILISVPHDGCLRPSNIADRESDQNGNLKNDKNTRKFSKALRDELRNLFYIHKGVKVQPFLIYNNLHRIKMDPNRDLSNCCANNSHDAFLAYSDYHSMIDICFKTNFMMNSNFEQGLILDIHGNSHIEEWVELGYLIKKTDLDQERLDNSLKTSINLLASKSPYSLDEIIRGEKLSLGSLIQNKLNCKVVPSPEYKSPNDGNYYSGGFITEKHGSFNDNFFRLNSIQLELPSFMRTDNKNLNIYAQKIASAIYEFYNIHDLDTLK